jgi:hypothetical protein
LVCREALINFRTDAGNGLVQILQCAQVGVYTEYVLEPVTRNARVK